MGNCTVYLVLARRTQPALLQRRARTGEHPFIRPGHRGASSGAAGKIVTSLCLFFNISGLFELPYDIVLPVTGSVGEQGGHGRA